MKVIGRPQIAQWMRLHPKAKGALQSWLREAEVASWSCAHEVQSRYGAAQITPSGAVIFPISARHFHLETRVCFPAQAVLIVGFVICGDEQFTLQLQAEENADDYRPTAVSGGRHEH